MEIFERGLKPIIKRAISPIRLHTFEYMSEGARKFEKENSNFQMFRGKQEKRRNMEQHVGG